MKNENVFYACPYCKTEYTNPVDLAHCILSCEEKKKKDEEAKKAKELALVKEARKREVEEKRDEYYKTLKSYLNDYGISTNSEVAFPYSFRWLF